MWSATALPQQASQKNRPPRRRGWQIRAVARYAHRDTPQPVPLSSHGNAHKHFQ